eukprot:CAMPEP_0117551648 /NCGR_PEP_ID=MMETSP0784-20121206/49298_1 /TAXON_ID=39447 /ORGANISM="" /LENGTH=133 /DNA_ID=CAMNT_0005348691 /DNA_START=504 /DNA_END=902 /DNA_ORIENTATION=-
MAIDRFATAANCAWWMLAESSSLDISGCLCSGSLPTSSTFAGFAIAAAAAADTSPPWAPQPPPQGQAVAPGLSNEFLAPTAPASLSFWGPRLSFLLQMVSFCQPPKVTSDLMAFWAAGALDAALVVSRCGQGA